MLDFDQIKELIEMVAAKRLERVELERAGFRLAIVGRSVQPSNAPAAGVAQGAVSAEDVTASETSPEAPPDDGEGATQNHVLTSQLVGTFYVAPSPDSEPFVSVGDRVKPGQVLCIVEAMKLMNEIESDVEGEIVAVLPKNGQPVEFGEPLFEIKVT